MAFNTFTAYLLQERLPTKVDKLIFFGSIAWALCGIWTLLGSFALIPERFRIDYASRQKKIPSIEPKDYNTRFIKFVDMAMYGFSAIEFAVAVLRIAKHVSGA